MLINIVILRINHAIFIIERKKTKQRVLMKKLTIMQNKIQQILNKNRQVTNTFHY